MQGVVSPAVVPRDFEDSLRKTTVDIARALRLRGIMDVEVIASPKGTVFLEIDARIPSQTPLAVWLSSGRNLLLPLANAFLKGKVRDEVGEAPPLFAILEHLSVLGKRITLVGENSIARARPLALTDAFFGADLALTDMDEGLDSFCATVMLRAPSAEELALKRAELYGNLSEKLGGAPPELSEGPLRGKLAEPGIY